MANFYDSCRECVEGGSRTADTSRVRRSVFSVSESETEGKEKRRYAPLSQHAWRASDTTPGPDSSLQPPPPLCSLSRSEPESAGKYSTLVPSVCMVPACYLLSVAGINYAPSYVRQ